MVIFKSYGYLVMLPTNRMTLQQYESTEIIHHSEEGLRSYIASLRESLSPLQASKMLYAVASNPLYAYSMFMNHTPKKYIDKIEQLAPDLLYSRGDKGAAVIITALWIRALLGKPYEASQLAYYVAGMYPITDDIIDNEDYTVKQKIVFCEKIEECIRLAFEGGNDTKLYDSAMRKKVPIDLISLIKRFAKDAPDKHRETLKTALIELNEWQKASIEQFSQDTPTERLFEISYMKGFATFRLIALIVDPEIDETFLQKYSHFGGLYQLFDDLDDLQEDCQAGLATYASAGIIPETLWQDNRFSLPDKFAIALGQLKTKTQQGFIPYISRLIGHIDIAIKALTEDKPYLPKLITQYLYDKLLEVCDEITPSIQVQDLRETALTALC